MSCETPTLRLFFALWPGSAERSALARWQPALHALCGGRVMRPETLHLTLAFLGQVERARLAALQQTVREVSVPSFPLCLDTLRYWAHNRIVYAAPSAPPAALGRLAAELAERLRHAGWAFDARPFQPHVTLLRSARCPAVLPLPAAPVHWAVHDMALVSSVRDEQGAHYEVLARFGADPPE